MSVKNKKWRFLIAFIIFFVILTLWFVVKQKNIEETSFIVSPGDTFITVGNNLARQDIIDSRFLFWAYTLSSGRAQRIQAGEYSFEGPIALWQVIQAVSRGMFLKNEKTVVIPEGFNTKQIEERLKENSILDSTQSLDFNIKELSKEFSFLSNVTNLEGFLFPDTYKFEIGSSVQNIIKKFLSNFNRKTELVQEKAKMVGKDFYDIIILAFILEKEVPVSDMPLAADVLLKRLHAGVPLQVDASLVYVLERTIKRGDISSLDSLFNTYKYMGLPPAPISNPGIAAIEAAFNPVANDYWYYLSSSETGETIFSRTLEDHNQAKVIHLK